MNADGEKYFVLEAAACRNDHCIQTYMQQQQHHRLIIFKCCTAFLIVDDFVQPVCVVCVVRVVIIISPSRVQRPCAVHCYIFQLFSCSRPASLYIAEGTNASQLMHI